MKQIPNHAVVNLIPRTWFGRILTGLGAIIAFFLALFFFTIIALAGIIALIVMRIWWVQRKMPQETSERVIEVEYSVKNEKAQRHDKGNASDPERSKSLPSIQ